MKLLYLRLFVNKDEPTQFDSFFVCGEENTTEYGMHKAMEYHSWKIAQFLINNSNGKAEFVWR